MNEQLSQFYKDRLAILNEFGDETSKEAKQKNSEYREDMRNYSLAIGALAAAGFASLSATVTKIEIFVLFGSSLLAVTSFVCFVHLFADNRKELSGILKFRESLKPLESVIAAFEKLSFGKITRSEYDLVEVEYEKYRINVLAHERDLTKSFDTNNVDILLLLSSTIGLLIMLSAFLIPIFNNYLGLHLFIDLTVSH